MRIVFIRQSKGKAPEIAALVQDYAKRIKAYATLEIIEPRSRGTADKYVPPAVWNETSSHRVVLDEAGREYASTDLAQKIKRWKDDPGIKSVCFFIGEPYGVPASILKTAHEKWSLSKGTLPSDIAWLVTVEQVYRGLSILAGSPYHHE